MPTASITAVGGYLPDFVLDNATLESLVDTSDDWITERTGIKERRVLRGKDQGVSVMGIAAAKEVLDKRGMSPEELDLVIFCTVTPDMTFPASANVLTDELGATNAWGFDLGAACSGFIYGLAVGAQFIQTGAHQRVLVVGADKMSSIIDYEDRNTCVIFGDGAGAVLLEPDESGNGVQDFVLKSDGGGAKHLHMKAGGSNRPPTLDTVRAREHFVYQEGKQVFKRATADMAQVSAEIMERNNLTADDVAWLVPHQANLRIIDFTIKRMGLSRDKTMINIQRYGNTTSGTIPLCLWDYEALLRPGENIILTSFGGGFTWGAIYLKWAYDGSKVARQPAPAV